MWCEIVKSLTEEGSVGISQASFVTDDEQLKALIERDAVICAAYDAWMINLRNTRLPRLRKRELIFACCVLSNYRSPIQSILQRGVHSLR